MQGPSQLIAFCRASFVLSSGVSLGWFLFNFLGKNFHKKERQWITHFCLTRSSVIESPSPGTRESIDGKLYKSGFRGNFSCSSRWHTEFWWSKFFGNGPGWWFHGPAPNNRSRSWSHPLKSGQVHWEVGLGWRKDGRIVCCSRVGLVECLTEVFDPKLLLVFLLQEWLSGFVLYRSAMAIEWPCQVTHNPIQDLGIVSVRCFLRFSAFLVDPVALVLTAATFNVPVDVSIQFFSFKSSLIASCLIAALLGMSSILDQVPRSILNPPFFVGSSSSVDHDFSALGQRVLQLRPSTLHIFFLFKVHQGLKSISDFKLGLCGHHWLFKFHDIKWSAASWRSRKSLESESELGDKEMMVGSHIGTSSRPDIFHWLTPAFWDTDVIDLIRRFPVRMSLCFLWISLCR